MVSTVWSVSCLLFYSWCPPCPAICKSGDTCSPCPWSRRHWGLAPSPASPAEFSTGRTHRATWPVATPSYHRTIHYSEFRIGSCQCPKTWLYRKTSVYDATTKIKPCYRQKIAFFPLWRLQRLLRMRSITWPVHRRSPKTTRNNFFTPNCLSLYNFYAATMTIKGSFILEHPHVKAVFGRKKTKASQNRSPKWRFFGNLRVQI